MVNDSRKISILDTSALLHDPNALFAFEKNIVIIPFPVLEEIDDHKSRNESTAAGARQVSRLLDGVGGQNLLNRGVPLEGGGIIMIDSDPYIPKDLTYALKLDSVDNFVIGVALKWQHRKESMHKKKGFRDHAAQLCKRYDITDVRIITKDINLRIKAGGCGIDAEDYERSRVISQISDLYTGLADISIEKESALNIFRMFYEGKDRSSRISLKQVEQFVKLPQLLPNMGCTFRNGDDKKTALAIYKEEKGESFFSVVPKHQPGTGSNRGIKPRNDQQSLAYKLLLDLGVRIVTLSGIAGSGKTLMALLAGLEQLKSGIYDQMLIYRANSEIGEKVGFLKGSLAEKTDPWARPVMDSLELIAEGGEREIFETPSKKKTLFDIPSMIKSGKIEISLINFLRGRSLHHKYVVVDETQNFKPGDIKKVLQRLGKGSKIILTGDAGQVDNPFLDPLSNGLTHVIERLKGQPTIAHVSFPKSERDELVDLVTKLL